MESLLMAIVTASIQVSIAAWEIADELPSAVRYFVSKGNAGIPELLKLKNGKADVSLGILHVLSQIETLVSREAITGFLKDRDSQVRDVAVTNYLYAIRPDSFGVHGGPLVDDIEFKPVWEIGSKALPGIQSMLNHRTSGCQFIGAKACKGIPDPRVIDILLTALPKLRHAALFEAAWVLGDRGGKKVRMKLIEYIDKDFFAEMDFTPVGGAFEMIGEDTVPELSEALSSSMYASQHFHIVLALNRIGGTRAGKAIAGAAKNKDPIVRWNVALFLRRYPGPETTKALKLLAKDSDSRVRETAAESMRALGIQ